MKTKIVRSLKEMDAALKSFSWGHGDNSDKPTTLAVIKIPLTGKRYATVTITRHREEPKSIKRFRHGDFSITVNGSSCSRDLTQYNSDLKKGELVAIARHAFKRRLAIDRICREHEAYLKASKLYYKLMRQSSDVARVLESEFFKMNPVCEPKVFARTKTTGKK